MFTLNQLSTRQNTNVFPFTTQLLLVTVSASFAECCLRFSRPTSVVNGCLVSLLHNIFMEAIIKKYQQKFRKAKDEMSKWDELQFRLVSQFRNASSIIDRLQIIQNSKYYAGLNSVGGIELLVLQKQMDSLQTLLQSMKSTMEEFRAVVLSLDKLQNDAKQLAKVGSNQMNRKQLQQRIGLKPSIEYCIDGLMLLYEMHHAEFLLKSSLVSALSALALKPNSSDLGALQQLLVDQPNIVKEEVEYIFDVIFAEEIS